MKKPNGLDSYGSPVNGNKIKSALTLTQRLLTRAIDHWEHSAHDADAFLLAWNDLQLHVREVTAHLTNALRLAREEADNGEEEKKGG